VTAGRSRHRQLLPDPVGPEPQKPPSLRGIAYQAKADTRHQFREWYRCWDAELWLDCWQDLPKEVASGVAHVMADAYAANLWGTSRHWCNGKKRGTTGPNWYDAVTFRKQTDTARPLGLLALEDKLVRLACAKLLPSLWEQAWLDGSYGYRAGREALDAIRALTRDLQYGRYGSLGEADVQGFCDAPPASSSKPPVNGSRHGSSHIGSLPGPGILPASAGATTRSLQLLWRASALSLTQPLLPLGDGLYVESERVCLKALLCPAEASTPEEPEAGKPHARDCTGGRGTGIPTVEAMTV